MTEVRVLKCTCANKYQDRKYGEGKRVCNRTNNSTFEEYRCTICRALIRG